MKSAAEVKARATKLRQVLGGLGHQLKHTETLEVIAKIEGYADWNTHAADISAKQKLAEQFLDEILEAESELNYAKFVKRREERYLPNFTERDFNRAVRNLNEDCGACVNREYMGSIHDILADVTGRFPGNVKHLWRGVCEKGEVFIVLGIYQRDGKDYVSHVNYR